MIFFAAGCPPSANGKGYPDGLKKQERLQRRILIPYCCGGEACTAMHGVMLRLSWPDDGDVVII